MDNYKVSMLHMERYLLKYKYKYIHFNIRTREYYLGVGKLNAIILTKEQAEQFIAKGRLHELSLEPI